MIGSPGNRMAKAGAFAVIAGLSALLGFSVASWRNAQTAEQDALRSRKMKAELRCAHYWASRRGAADAEYQFNRGRRSLLEVVGAVDPSIEYVVPGLREGEAVARTRNIRLPGPRLHDLGVAGGQLSLSFFCGPAGVRAYALDYNVAMMRLLGRSQHVYPSPVSPEIVSLDRGSAN